MGVDDNTIHKLAIEALREKERQELLGIIKPTEVKEELKVSFKKHELPDEAVTFMGLVEFYELQQSHEYPENFVKAVEYVDSRKISMRKYDFYVTQDIKHKMDKRVIIPFTWKGQTIGYTARAMVDGITPKYYNEVDSGYVFNIDKQERDWKFVIVCEGIFDAMSLDGVACMGSNITAQQIDLIEDLDREIIVVPDWNKTGGKLIDIALANKWAVAFPVWAETCADINEAVQKYGKLFVMKSIIDSVERSNLKIQLKRKQLR
jgi:DNA primase